MAIDQSSRPKRPESDDPEKDSGPKECNWRLKLWLDSLPPGGTFSVVSPGDDGYEQAKKLADEEMASMFGPAIDDHAIE